jgi:hypothetical protein
VEKYGTAIGDIDMNIIRRMRIVGWITNAIGTQSEYVIPLYPETMVTRMRLTVTL